MKNILIFINSLSCGGAERTAVWLAGCLVCLVDQGHEVSLITLYDGEGDYFTLPSGIRRLSLGGKRENTGGIRENLQYCRSLRKYLKHGSPDVVLALQTGSAVLCLLSSIGMKHRVIVAERNYPGRKKVSVLLTMLRKILYRFADGIVSQTDITRKWIEDHCRCSNVFVIPNTVHWPIRNAEPVLDPDTVVAQHDHVLLAVGRFHTQKGFDLLIEAFAQCAAEYPDWKLVVLGDNARGGSAAQQRDVLEKLIASKGLNKQVVLPGRAGNIAQWYERADLFVLSSRFEGFPNVLLEAMASGCACVAYDCLTGPSEIIENGKNGVLVPPESISGMAQALARVMGDAALREQLGHAARDVVHRFSEESVLQLWIEALGITQYNGGASLQEETRKGAGP